MANADEISLIKNVIGKAFNDLKKNDSDFIKLPEDCEGILSEGNNQQMERKLHEVCINHRFANYL